MEKYVNDAIIGNSTILVSLNNKGEILRYFAPNIDYMQHIANHQVGIIIENRYVNLGDSDVFKYNQYYEKNTNILYTKIYNENIKILQRDYVDIENNVLVRKYVIEKNNTGLDISKLLIYSELNTNVNNYTSGWYNEELNSLIQYSKDSYFTTFSKNKITNYQINDAKSVFYNLEYNKKDYIGMSNSSVIEYEIEDNEITIFISFRDSLYLTKNLINLLNTIDEKLMYEDNVKYWNNIVNKIKKYNFENDKQEEIYIRSVLLLLMYTNDKTGGMIASCEVDENFTHCGRYAYCWPRDSVYLTEALNICGLKEISNFFYTKFCRATQLDNGMWEQRYYTDGNLAPCWGLQLDETACVVIGIIKQYLLTKDENFLNIMQESLDKAIEYLLKQLDIHTNLNNTCYDLWEMNEGQHLYTLCSIYYAFKMYVENIETAKFASLIKIKMDKMYNNIFEKYWSEDLGFFRRNLNDNILDTSVLGLIWPFDILDITNEKVKITAHEIEKRLTSPVGGIYRFEYDHYMQTNPWIICTLWLCIYYIKKYKVTGNIEEYNKAKEYLDWVTNHATELGFLPEQISRVNEKELWVNALGWSHAMYIICINEIYNENWY
ncbi:MAG: hypothetical protein E7311_07240 [Clostridiales bacterium]|nr:hypothetical protein [Clostridiales bacterium]